MAVARQCSNGRPARRTRCATRQRGPRASVHLRKTGTGMAPDVACLPGKRVVSLMTRDQAPASPRPHGWLGDLPPAEFEDLSAARYVPTTPQ